MDSQRFTVLHIQEALIKEKVPGKWVSTQNVYNLVNGKTVPKDGYVFIFLSSFLDVDIRQILYRYSNKTAKRVIADNDLF